MISFGLQVQNSMIVVPDCFSTQKLGSFSSLPSFRQPTHTHTHTHTHTPAYNYDEATMAQVDQIQKEVHTNVRVLIK